jgi:hypothetical protein
MGGAACFLDPAIMVLLFPLEGGGSSRLEVMGPTSPERSEPPSFIAVERPDRYPHLFQVSCGHL